VTDATTADLPALRQAINRLLDVIEQRHGATVPLRADHYWVLGSDAAFNLQTRPTPSDITTGQLADDVASIDELADRTNEELVVWHDLAHVVRVLDRLATLDRAGPPG
jgi:hypothetical protein